MNSFDFFSRPSFFKFYRSAVPPYYKPLSYMFWRGLLSNPPFSVMSAKVPKTATLFFPFLSASTLFCPVPVGGFFTSV